MPDEVTKMCTAIIDQVAQSQAMHLTLIAGIIVNVLIGLRIIRGKEKG